MERFQEDGQSFTKVLWEGWLKNCKPSLKATISQCLLNTILVIKRQANLGGAEAPFTSKGVAYYESCFIVVLSVLCIQVVKSNGILVKEVLMDKVSRLCNGIYSEAR
ncbi:hypothetical protein A1QW_03665 [Vibrio anguillarum]|nr:hypothetical protein A1QW_03665 [Vibrio anguillarum]OEF89213.1 hypothetical protein A1QY_04980 [Vibrio anguillarum]